MTVLDNILVVITEKSVFGALFSKHNKLDEKKPRKHYKKSDFGKNATNWQLTFPTARGNC